MVLLFAKFALKHTNLIDILQICMKSTPHGVYASLSFIFKWFLKKIKMLTVTASSIEFLLKDSSKPRILA